MKCPLLSFRTPQIAQSIGPIEIAVLVPTLDRCLGESPKIALKEQPKQTAFGGTLLPAAKPWDRRLRLRWS